MPGSFIDRSLLVSNPPPNMDATSDGQVYKKYFITDSFVTPNSLFRYEISDGVHRLFHARDKEYGFIEKNSYGKTPFYLKEQERVLGLLGILSQNDSNFDIISEGNNALKQDFKDGTEDTTKDLSQARVIAEKLVGLSQVKLYPDINSELLNRYSSLKK